MTRRNWMAVLWTSLMTADFDADGSLASGGAYVVNAYSFLAIASLALFGALHIFSEHNYVVGYLEFAGAGVLALNVLGLRLARNVPLARFGFLATVLVMLFVMLATGGTQGTGIFWFFVYPVSAFFLAGKKQGLMWMAALVGMAGLAALLGQLSIIVLAYSFIEIRQLLATLIVVALGVYVYQRSRETLQGTSKASEKALQAEKVRAETVLAIIDEGVLAIDTEGRIIMMNQAAERMLGWRFVELAEKRFMEMVPLVDDRGELINAKNPLDVAASRKTRPAHTLGYRRKDGSSFPAAIVAQSITDGRRVQGTLITFRDITQERAIDRAKTEFITLASHQLRTPISAIAWLTELLIDDRASFTTEQRKQIKEINQSNQRMAALVDAMLKVSSLELGNVPIHLELFDPATIAHRTLTQQLTALGAQRKLHIVEQYDKSLGTVRFDLAVYKTILNNLITNAIKYTPAGGTIKLVLEPSATLLFPGSTASLLITVTDTGYGIPKLEQVKIFTKFFRAKNIHSKDTDGTGLGLYIVKALVEYVGGRISFSSVEGRGTTFSVLVPLEEIRKK